MTRRLLAPVAVVVLALILTVPVWGFFNQVDALKAELVAWKGAHASDFGDLMSTLNNLSGPSFNDVSDTDWFNPYVATVSGWGVVSGYKDAQGKPTGVFGPANHVTLAEMLKMAFIASNVDTTTCGSVPPLHSQAIGHWAQAYVSCAEQMNVRVLKDPSVDINRPATRGEVLSMIDDISGTQIHPLYSNFKDVQGNTYEADIAYAYLHGIVTGDKNSHGVDIGTFRPNDPINRAEVAKIIYEWAKEKVKAQQTAQS